MEEEAVSPWNSLSGVTSPSALHTHQPEIRINTLPRLLTLQERFVLSVANGSINSHTLRLVQQQLEII